MSAKQTKPRRASRESFASYIYKVLKQVHADAGLSRKAMNVLDSMAYQVMENLASEAGNICTKTKKQTIGAREIRFAVKTELTGELIKHATSESDKAVTNFIKAKEAEKKKKTDGKSKTNSSRAGLNFPVGRVSRILKKGHYAKRIGEHAGVALTAIMEYLMAEVLELSGNAARDNKKMRISTRHILLAVKNDEELIKLFNGTIPQSGVLPNIRAELLPKKKGSKKQVA